VSNQRAERLAVPVDEVIDVIEEDDEATRSGDAGVAQRPKPLTQQAISTAGERYVSA
jgi:hypothetical protein